MDRLAESAELELVCGAIVDRYHGALREALSHIRDTLSAISVSAATPELERVRVAFDDAATQIRCHMTKEEYLLFPAIAALSAADRDSGRRPAMAFATVLHPIRLMEAEHARIEEAWDRLRVLARAVVEPEGSASGWREVRADFAQLDAELRAHHRVENEILFPRALELEGRLL